MKEKESNNQEKQNINLCPLYSEIPYINTDPVEGFKWAIVSSVQGRCADMKRDCCCMGLEKFCEKKKKKKK